MRVPFGWAASAAFAMTCVSTIAHAESGGRGPVAPSGAVVQAAPSVSIASGAAEGGAGRLIRTRFEIEVNLHLVNLDPDTYYTAWWFVFNNPAACATTPCGLGDVLSGVGHAFNAGGFAAGADGLANVAFSTPRGAIPEGRDRVSRTLPFLDPALETGLDDPFRAEIHVVARAHGAVGAGDPVAQMTLFDGGCGVDLALCTDDQAVIFLAP